MGLSAAEIYEVASLRIAGNGNSDLSADRIITLLEDSKLRGLGGAGFPTGRKWHILRDQPAPRLMAVNIDEGEPGTFKDRQSTSAAAVRGTLGQDAGSQSRTDNTDRRVQLGRSALDPPGDARQDLDIIVDMAHRLGLNWDYPGPAAVFDEMRKAMPS